MARLKHLQAGGYALWRVVSAAVNPLDTSFALQAGGRWNPPGAFPVLYTCCALRVARAIVNERLAELAVGLEDLAPSARPRLCEIHWTGRGVDVSTEEGVITAGLSRDYPSGVGHELTRPLALAWHETGEEGVFCRSASLSRLGYARWSGDYRDWSELALFTLNTRESPALVSTDDSLAWLA